MQLLKIKQKKAAIELSIGTVVIIVLAMTMLILGIVLIRNILTGATDSVTQINEGVRSEIVKLFQDESDRAVLRLSDNTAKIKQGEEFGFAFGIRNNEQGTTSSRTFQYQTSLVSKGTCQVSDITAQNWVLFGSGSVAVPPGQVEGKIIRFKIPEESPLCTAEYKITIWRPDLETPSTPYADLQFFIKIESSGIF